MNNSIRITGAFAFAEPQTSASKKKDCLGYAAVGIPLTMVKTIRSMESPPMRWKNDREVYVHVYVWRHHETGDVYFTLPASPLDCDARVWFDLLVLTESGRALLLEGIREYWEANHPQTLTSLAG